MNIADINIMCDKMKNKEKGGWGNGVSSFFCNLTSENFWRFSMSHLY
jgi:hypothetical protein